MFFIWGERAKGKTVSRLFLCAERHGILKNFFNKAVDNKIYFNFSICQKKKTQNKKIKLYSYIYIQCRHFQSTYIRKRCVSFRPYDNTVYATIKFTKTIASAVIQTSWFYISIHKKKIDIFPALLFPPTAACFQSSRAGLHTCFQTLQLLKPSRGSFWSPIFSRSKPKWEICYLKITTNGFLMGTVKLPHHEV